MRNAENQIDEVNSPPDRTPSIIPRAITKLQQHISISLFLFILAFSVRDFVIFALHTYKDLDRYELERTAISLAATGVYGNPYAIPTGPTAHVSPGYTLILSGLFRIFGTGYQGEFAKNLFAAAVTSFLCALLPFVSRKIGIGQAVGVVSGLFCALFPIKALTELQGDWEAPYTAIALALLISLTCQTWAKRVFSLQEGLTLGLLWGISLLFASVLLPLYGVLAIAGCFWSFRISLNRYLAFFAVQTTLVLLLLLPWMIRNQIALGSPIATRSNVGIELRVSNNDYATADQRVNYLLGVYDRYHPLQNKEEALKVRKLGEVRYNAQMKQAAFTWINTHRQRFLVLTLNRVRCFWLYPEPSRIKGTVEDAFAIFGITGLIVLFFNQRFSALIVLASLLCYSAPSYFVHVGNRQRYPVDWLLVMLSFYCFSNMYPWVRRQLRRTDR